MPKLKYNCELLKCALPPDEALRRTMQVKQPKDWKKPILAMRKSRVKSPQLVADKAIQVFASVKEHNPSRNTQKRMIFYRKTVASRTAAGEK